jgi:hypothetical protein
VWNHIIFNALFFNHYPHLPRARPSFIFRLFLPPFGLALFFHQFEKTKVFMKFLFLQVPLNSDFGLLLISLVYLDKQERYLAQKKR